MEMQRQPWSRTVAPTCDRGVPEGRTMSLSRGLLACCTIRADRVGSFFLPSETLLDESTRRGDSDACGIRRRAARGSELGAILAARGGMRAPLVLYTPYSVVSDRFRAGLRCANNLNATQRKQLIAIIRSKVAALSSCGFVNRVYIESVVAADFELGRVPQSEMLQRVR
jgi:hypothetical protein